MNYLYLDDYDGNLLLKRCFYSPKTPKRTEKRAETKNHLPNRIDKWLIFKCGTYGMAHSPLAHGLPLGGRYINKKAIVPSAQWLLYFKTS